MLKKSDLPAPSPLKEETVSVQELGGDVLVRGLMLRDRIDIANVDGYNRISSMLAAGVLVAGEKGAMVPLYNAEEWERWGANNLSAAMKLWDTVRRLSDLGGEEAEKNSPAQKSESPAP